MADVVVAEFCADYFGVFLVPSSRGDSDYEVELYGGEGPAYCPCKGFRYRADCRHLKEVWEKACLWNPQWHPGGPVTCASIRSSFKPGFRGTSNANGCPYEITNDTGSAPPVTKALMIW